MGWWVVGTTGKNPNSSPLELYNKGKNSKNVGFSTARKEKNHPMVPPLDHFQGKNKNCSSLARTISTSRRSFFSNLTTFERRSGPKIFSPSQNLDFENGVIVKISKS